MALTPIKQLITSRPVFVTGGVAVVLLTALWVWMEIAAPVNFRQPVPSPDGHYFAYFDLIHRNFPDSESDYDLIIATTGGKLSARFRMAPGAISWSNADFLSVVNSQEDRAWSISNNDGRFLMLKELHLASGTKLCWSQDGTKLAYVDKAPEPAGIAVYDFDQTRVLTVPFPEGFKLTEPTLLFWSPGSNDLYFLNSNSEAEALIRVGIHTGQLRELAQGAPAWKGSSVGRPRMSPDGNKIFLPSPIQSVIDAETGQIIWKLPAGTKPLWSVWSSDGHKIFYTDGGGPEQVFVHDFSSGSDRLISSNAPPHGFMSSDGGSFLVRAAPPSSTPDFTSQWSEWVDPQWGWQQVNVVSGQSQPLGRAELSPWEQSQDGAVLMARDDWWQVHYGLYDPARRSFAEFHFPTDTEDKIRQAKTEIVILCSILLYGLLAFFIYLARPASPAARALSFLSLVLMVLFTSLSAVDAVLPLANPPFPADTKLMDLVAMGWAPISRRLWIVEGSAILTFLAAALVPPALLHFSLVFPERNKFLNRKSALKWFLYFAALAPLIGVLQLISGHRASTSIQPILIGFYLIAGPVTIITALFALLHSYRHPPDRHVKDQVRWVGLAFAGPPLGLAALFILSQLLKFLGQALGYAGPNIPGSYFFVTGLSLLCLFPPVAIGYALMAHKLFDIRLLIRRSLRYSLITSVVGVIYLAVVGGLSWGIAGSLVAPSQPVVIVSTLFTALIVAPVRNKLQAIIDRTFDRTHYDVREALQKFSLSLPTILDRQTLEVRIRESVTNAMKCSDFHLFILDRRSKKLRLQAAAKGSSSGISDIEFDTAEPLCTHLLEKGHFLDLEILPFNETLLMGIRSEKNRPEPSNAALILGLVRRGELVGMMVLGPKASDEFYNAEDIQLLQGVAHQAAAAVENTELFEEVARDRELRRELEVASEVQAQLFPVTIPSSLTVQITGRCLPASSVSGDYYDFLELPGGKIALAIGDVSGKGMAAALLMANLQGLLRTQAPTAASPAELVRQINRQLYGASRGAKYCTFFYGIYNERDRRLTYSSAGHNAPLLLSAAGTRFLDSTGVPLGLFPEVVHEMHCEQLEPGALILLYSDGITEARNPDGEDYGVDRLAACLARSQDADPEELVDKILDDVRDFSSGAPVEDDRTIVLLKIRKDSELPKDNHPSSL